MSTEFLERPRDDPLAGPAEVREAIEVEPAGRPPVPLLYWRDSERVYVVPSDSSARWVPAVLEQPFGLREAGEVRHDLVAALVTDPAEADRARDGLRRKYGRAVWEQYFERSDRVIRLEPATGRRGSPSEDSLRTEFDAVAPRYAIGVERQALQRYLKDRTTTWLLGSLAGLDPLLEIGPGVGIETIPLLRAGHEVVAIDLSPRMLGELARRAADAGGRARLRTIEAPLRGLADATRAFPDGAFGAAYSTFGAFNLEREVSGLPASLGRLVRPGGLLMFSSLNRPGFVPVAWELALGNRRGARGRLLPRVPASLSRYPLDVFPRNPAYWDGLLAPAFLRIDTAPASVLAPPFEGQRLVRRLGEAGRRRARSLDASLSRSRLLAPLAEWTLLTYRRSAGAAPAPRGG